MHNNCNQGHEYQPLTAPILPARATQHPLPAILLDCAQGSGRLPNGSLVTYNPRQLQNLRETHMADRGLLQPDRAAQHPLPSVLRDWAKDLGLGQWLAGYPNLAPRRRSNIYVRLSLR